MGNVLVGYASGISKKNGKPWYRVDLVCDQTIVAQQSGAIGRTVRSEFIPEGVYNQLKPEWVDKRIDIQYEIYGRYANIVGINIS